MKRAYSILMLALGCQHAPTPYGNVLERGGELAQARLDEQKVVIGPRDVVAWGLIEVPDGARLQATYAGVDALARAELLKVVRVRIQDEMVSVDSTDPARVAAYEHTVETVSGSLRHSGTTLHGWERVRRGEQVIRRVWSRLTIPRAEFDAAF